MVRSLLFSALLAGAVLGAPQDTSSTSGATERRDCVGLNAISPKCRSNEVLHTRDFFYVGANYVTTNNVTLATGQLYVEKLTPGRVSRPKPLVFFHGGGSSSVTWFNTPDNRKGFISYFLENGYQIYVVEHKSVGRSADVDLTTYPINSIISTEGVEAGFTALKKTNAYPQSQLHTQWPGTGERGDPYFDAFAAGFIPYSNNTSRLELAIRSAGCKLLSLIGPSYLISHSMGASNSILLSNDCPEYVAGNINLEPATIPFQTFGWGLGGIPTRAWGLANTPLDYDPPVQNASELQTVVIGNETLARRSCVMQVEPARQLPNIASVPYLILTGEASVHITYNHCTVDYLKQVGASPDWIKLSEIGINGNGHFMHMEKNSLRIARVVQDWIRLQDKASY